MRTLFVMLLASALINAAEPAISDHDYASAPNTASGHLIQHQKQTKTEARRTGRARRPDNLKQNEFAPEKQPSDTEAQTSPGKSGSAPVRAPSSDLQRTYNA